MDDDITQLISAADISGLATSDKQDDQTDILTTINASIDNIEIAVTNPANGYEFYAYEDTGTYVYIMSQNANDAWICKRMTSASGYMEYAKGSSDTATNWTNRATLDYNDYAHTF